MRNLFAVTRTRGRAWDPRKHMRSQAEWEEHAAFMDNLAAGGFVLLGGPLLGSSDILLVIDAADESAVNAALADDPWSRSGILETKNVRTWQILLEAEK
jgi:uncharacterized protein YciI